MTMEDILERYGVPYRTAGNHHHARPGWIQVDCPLCTPNAHHFRLGYNISKRYWTCWSCGSVPFGPTLRDLIDQPWAVVKELSGAIEASRVPVLEPSPRGRLVVPAGAGPLLGAHRAYLKRRKFDPDELYRVWGVRGFPGFGPTPKRFWWRLFVPMVWRGEVVSWTTRSLNPDAALRYVSASPAEEKYDHKTLLGGEDLVPGHAVCAVEGPFDAFRVGPGAVWLSGTAYKRAQMLRLSRYPVRVVCFDNSPEAQVRARKLVRELEGYDGVTYNVKLDAADPGDAGPEEIAELRKLLQ